MTSRRWWWSVVIVGGVALPGAASARDWGCFRPYHIRHGGILVEPATFGHFPTRWRLWPVEPPPGPPGLRWHSPPAAGQPAAESPTTPPDRDREREPMSDIPSLPRPRITEPDR